MLSNRAIKALISLLEDDDSEVIQHVHQEIRAMGRLAIPFLETEWEQNLNPKVQSRIEDLLHSLQLESTRNFLLEWKEAHQDDLLHGLWAIATYQYPELNLQDLRKKIDEIYYSAWLRFKDNLHPYDQVKILNYVLFDELKFTANTKNFHSPGNSMINIVLESKRGNPITMCAVYLLIAQRFQLPIWGVNMPNQFILTYKSDKIQFYIHAFNKGLIFPRSDISNYIAQLNLSPRDEFYEPCTHMVIIQRILRNLILSFEHLGEQVKVEELKELLALLEED
jgi:regulator of sirC expression with transglutaminase-like and TPR domain